jgi:hypothetical protein
MLNTDGAVEPSGVVTVTFTVPKVAICAAATGAVNCLALMNLAARGVEPHLAVVEPETKFVPLMVNVNAAAPASTVAGLRLVMVGGA